MTVYRSLKAADALRSRPMAQGFDVSLADEHAGSILWLRDEDCGNPDALVAFVLRLAREFQLVGTWGFQFARWCSHREVESFGGGAFVLDLGAGMVLDQVCTQDWLDKRLQAD